MPKRRSLWSPYSSATTATTTLTADPTTETTTTYSHHHHHSQGNHHEDDPHDPPLPLPATDPLPSPSDTSARQIREISSRSFIRSWLGLNFASYAVAEKPTSSNRSLSNLKSTSSLSTIFASPSAVAASTFGEFSKPNNVQPAQSVVSISTSDTKAQPPESITEMNENSGTTSKRKNRNRTSTPPSVRRPRHRTSNSETISSGAWIFGEQTPTTTTTSTVTAISVTNPEDPLLTTIAPVNHDTARSSAEKNQGETERFMHLRSRSFNDRHSPRAARSSSQGSERNAIDRKSSLLSIAALTTHIMAMRADSPLSPSFSSPSITCGDAKETLATDNQKNESRLAVAPPTPLEAESSEQKVPRTSENRPLSITSSWWWFVSSGSTPSSTALQAQQAPDSALPGNPVLSNAASTVQNKKVGEGEEGKVEKTASASDCVEASRQDTQPPPSASPSLLSLKGASELVFGTVAFSRKKAKSETTREGGRKTDGTVVARSARSDTPELTTSVVETAVIEVDSDISKTTTAVSTVPLPSQASQIASPATKVTLPRTANFVLPQLPLPPELGTPPSLRTPPTPSRAPPLLPGAPTSILPEHGGDSIVTKALGVLGSMIWSKGEPDGEHVDDEVSKKDGNIRKKICEWPKEIRKIAIIGVHGWFPNKLFQRVIGEPTGTSPRFCTDMESAILHHIQTHHPNNPQHPEITLIPLEGEGKVLDRVALLHTALHARPDWVEAVKTADCVFVATHSQGSPVSTILLSKLLAERVDVDGSVMQTSTPPLEGKEVPSESNVEAKNTEPATDTTESDPKNSPSQPISDTSAASVKPSLIVSDLKHGPSETEEATDYFPGQTHLLDPTRQRIGMLAMAGISHGPFPFLKSNLIVRYLEAEAARELFEFMDCPGEDGSMDSSAAGFEDSSGGSTKREKKKDMELSRTYWKAMRDVLDKGVKVTCVASMADQVVPLYSATMHALSHPNLLRALYIDAPAAQEATSISQTGHKPDVPPISVELVPSSDPAAATLEWESSSSPVRSSAATMMERTVSIPTSSTSSPAAKTNLSHFPSNSSLVTEKPGPADLDFLTNLIVFALRLRNAGLSDHGLIVHLSEAVAGSLYGTGHSTIYEEPEVYSLAFKWLLTPKRCSQILSPPQTPPSDDPSPHTTERGQKKVPANNPKASYIRSSIPLRPTAHPATHILGTTPPSRPSLASPKLISPSNTQPRSTQTTQPSPKQTRTRSGLMYSVPLFIPPIPESQLEYFTATTNLNPYYLPWIIRALLGDPLVAANEDLALELQGIVQQFKNWEPREKAMRDLKYRLEPLRSHL